MQNLSSTPIKTFTIGFKEKNFNEADYAADIAKHIGTEHKCLYLSAEDALDIVQDIPTWCDEPFADSSQIPTFWVSKLARQFVTVALSGDGGDELFAGYNRYLLGQNIWNKLQYLPKCLRHILALGIKKLSPSTLDQIANFIPRNIRPSMFGHKAYILADVMHTEQQANFYKEIVSHWKNPSELLQEDFYGNSPELELYPWKDSLQHSDNNDFISAMQLTDMLTYLPDDILTKVDRASMALGLEVRVPLLDHRIIEFSCGLPLNLKIKNGTGKWLLRQILYKYVPQKLIERPKMGFGIPIGIWLRGAWRDWAENLLAADSLASNGLNVKLIRSKWQEHLSGKRDWQYLLWSVLMLQSWMAKYVN